VAPGKGEHLGKIFNAKTQKEKKDAEKSMGMAPFMSADRIRNLVAGFFKSRDSSSVSHRQGFWFVQNKR
jgi:hypothetical protein